MEKSHTERMSQQIQKMQAPVAKFISYLHADTVKIGSS
jgi:hypothetical protein